MGRFKDEGFGTDRLGGGDLDGSLSSAIPSHSGSSSSNPDCSTLFPFALEDEGLSIGALEVEELEMEALGLGGVRLILERLDGGQVEATARRGRCRGNTYS